MLTCEEDNQFKTTKTGLLPATAGPELELLPPEPLPDPGPESVPLGWAMKGGMQVLKLGNQDPGVACDEW